MNKFARFFAIFSIFWGCFSQSVFAVTSASLPEKDQLRELTDRQQRLEAELKHLHHALSALKRARVKKSTSSSFAAGSDAVGPISVAIGSPNPTEDDATASDLLTVTPYVERRIQQVAANYLHGITVTTSPILGLKSAWNPSDLLYAVPSMNQDLQLLEDRSAFEHRLNTMGSSLNTRPMLVFSGGFEVMTSYIDSYTNVPVLDVNVSTLELDVWAIVSAWTSGFMSIDFDNSAPQTGSRVTNSRLYIQRGFFTVGNLNATPWYMTMGQMYVPFGRYASALVTTPLTVSVARTEARSLLFGYFKNGLYVEGYGYKGGRRSGGKRLVFQGGGNIGYRESEFSFGALDIGVGYITNMADSQGIQNNALFPGLAFPATQFAGLADTVNVNGFTGNNLVHNAPGANFHMEFSRGIFALITEFAGVVNSFNAGDLMYNYHGASPKALHTEMDLNFKFGHIPLTIGAAYDESWDALALNLPRQSFFALISTSLFKDTVQSLEYRHDINYSQLASNAVGGAGNGNIANNIPVPGANIGGSQDLISFLFGVYF